MKTWFKALALAFLAPVVTLAGSAPALADAKDKRLDVYWVDVEGGNATLFVTPAGESILFDTGYPGDRDAERIRKTVTEIAGLKKIDHLVITHFHGDHYGALPDIVKRIPVGKLYERSLDSAPTKERENEGIAGYKAAKVGKRIQARLGQRLRLKQAKGAAKLEFRFIGMNEKFAPHKGAKDNQELCATTKEKPLDQSDNRNSLVTLVTFGPFRFFEGGDITWNTEAKLVCPRNLVGAPIDVFQIDHHGLDQSNNPVLVKTLAPTVAVVNNGPRKGGEMGSFEALKATPSIQTIYQVHRNVRLGPELNTAPELTANQDEDCAGNHIKLSVDPKGRTYTVSVPATNHEKTYETRAP